ncbi:sigma-70 family RNA polymerase sigma factor [Maribacter litopenaei]|uniref:Sigma-70 family RNA polymerase sigma factor n=1 Tax=Maribacter litopenaei TaxID=2976127 RepID=A0ABY5Y822_9FLAO|nr:sigma-70 family RNA polymerase sigma factor [Maribacter litopenaei]UWX55168.1 sigma-70 family RNA polymerase sigma factor [Maribacter litopenaei]
MMIFKKHIRDQLKEKLKEAISSLKADYRDIIIAVDFEGYTYKEIANQTGISPGTLMSRRHRAMSLLLKKLKTEKK